MNTDSSATEQWSSQKLLFAMKK